MWHLGIWSILVQVVAYYLMESNQYLNQCWDVIWTRSATIHVRAISQEILKTPITKMYSQRKLEQHFQGVNKLKHSHSVDIQGLQQI